MTSPLILVDVHGVLSPDLPCGGPGCPCHPGRIVIRHELKGRTHRMTVNPAHGPQLTTLAAEFGAELAWCTSWEDVANEVIGPAVGLPRLPVVPYPPMPRALRADGMPLGIWKAQHAVAYAGDRPFVWFEDEGAAAAAMLTLARNSCLVLVTDRQVGLTAGHLVQAREFLAEVTS